MRDLGERAGPSKCWWDDVFKKSSLMLMWQESTVLHSDSKDSFLCLAGINSLHAQVVTSTPTLPIAEDSNSIIFYSDRGSGGLKGFTGDVYAHTGVITS